MIDLNKMFPELPSMDFSKRDVVILPIESIIDTCPNELLWTGKLHLKELEELCNCTDENREEDLTCYECWRRASIIVMEHYFSGEPRFMLSHLSRVEL